MLLFCFVFCQAELCFKTHLVTPEVQVCTDALGEGFPALWPVLACSKRQWMDGAVVQIHGEL